MKRLALLVPLMLVIIFGYSVFPGNAQQGLQWKVEYFNNPYLMAPAAATQYVDRVALNWGGGAPASNVGADRFSARITSDVYFPAGTYRFYLLSDDRAHLYVDFQSQINNWDNNKVGQILSRDITLPSGTFHVQIDFREEQGNAYVFLDWENVADGIQGPNFQIPTLASGGSWRAEYYNNTTLSGPAFAVRDEPSPSHNWGTGAPISGMPADNFSVRWTSTQNFDGSPYQITVRADDGVRVFVDNVQYINQWGLATGQTYTATITPSAGNHTVRVEFYEAGEIAFVDFGLARTSIPTNSGGSWRAEYYSNTALSGPAFAVRDEPSPSHSWGTGAPLNGMPVDNFSVRWTNTQSFDGSPYQITVRADDGIRVFVDYVQYLNQWGLATGQTYTATITPSAGNHTVRVEFYEAGGVAFVDFGLARTTPTNTGTVNPTGAYLIVNTGRLNVRNIPSAYGSTIITKIDYGTTYPIIGINNARTWWKINVNHTSGWVSAPYVIAYNTANVPVVDGSASTLTLPVTGYKVTTIASLNVRTGPSVSSSSIGIIPAYASADVIGRNASASWWYVRYGEISGWISAGYAPIQYGANILTIPILG